MLDSYGSALSVTVAGASGGIGSALVDALVASPNVVRIHALSRTTPTGHGATVVALPMDLTDEESIARAAATVAQETGGTTRAVLVATGVLQDPAAGLEPEKTWRALDAEALVHSYRINTVGPALVAKHFLPLLPRQGKAVFAALSARVGSIEDNRLGGWYAYRASKAALNMVIRSLSIELARTRPDALCVALHPGTVATGLSAPFRSGVPDDKLFAAADAAAHLLTVLDGLETTDTGRLFAWDGSRIPF
ncbi:MAG: SDR family NAD(P)-dependent oxidoreductase [Inquilinaceae bacterium]